MGPLPEDINRFIDEKVESIDQLEILRVLGEARDRIWTADALACELERAIPNGCSRRSNSPFMLVPVSDRITCGQDAPGPQPSVEHMQDTKDHSTSENELYLKLFITNGGGW